MYAVSASGSLAVSAVTAGVGTEVLDDVDDSKDDGGDIDDSFDTTH